MLYILYESPYPGPGWVRSADGLPPVVADPQSCPGYHDPPLRNKEPFQSELQPTRALVWLEPKPKAKATSILWPTKSWTNFCLSYICEKFTNWYSPRLIKLNPWDILGFLVYPVPVIAEISYFWIDIFCG